MQKLLITLFIGISSLYLYAQTNIPTVDFVKVDQFGYLPNANKVAVISNPQIGYNSNQNFTAGTTYQVRNWQTGNVVFSGSPQQWSSGATHNQSGDKGWWFDFSSLTIPGSYYVYDVNNNVRSYKFDIDNNVYSQVLKVGMRMFFYNRCNFAKQAPYAEVGFTDGVAFSNNGQDANSRYIHDQNNPATEKDLAGGWFDAGDFNKYVTFADGAMHDLLSAFEENPQAFGDNFGIPESDNNIPDIIDELKWELDWLLKMNNADGSTHIKMGSRNYSENISVPPSTNTDPRFYGPVCSSASISVAGVFAHAALIMKQIPALSSYAQTLQSSAISSWNYVLPKLANNTLDTACDLGEIVSGDADWDITTQRSAAIRAAIYLFALTGNSSYNQYIINNIYNDAPNQTVNYYWDVYEQPLNDALLAYTKLPNASQSIANTIISVFQGTASNTNYGYYGFNSGDLYRAFMPTNAYHWGSNIPKAGYGILNLMAINSNVYPADNSSFNLKASEQLHYFHGVNPLNLVYLSNMRNYGAEKSCNEIYHNWFAAGSNWDNAQTSLYGPAPGYVSGGPNKDFTLNNPSPPAGQPAQKSYLDFNDGYPTNSWEITEPAIYYQARYIRLLANYVSTTISCPPLGSICDDGNPNTINDIENGFCVCEGTSTQPEVCELIVNGNFDNTLLGEWYWWNNDVNTNGSVANVTNINAGGNPWDAAFAQSNMIFEQGKNYTISFTASSVLNRSIYVKTSPYTDPSTSYFYQSINITTSPQVYTLNFAMTGITVLNGTLEFYLGENNTSITLDNISITADDCSDSCPPTLTINGTASDLLYEASNRIDSKGSITPNGNVHFHAGNRIELKSDFSVPSSANFRAAIEPCGTSTD